MKKIILLFLAIIALTGCVGAVQSVTSGPRAEVTFRSKPLPSGGIKGWSVQLNFYMFECRDKYSARVRYSDSENHTYFFRADEPLYVDVRYFQLVAGGHLSGDHYMNFVPRDGEKYVIEYVPLSGTTYKVDLYQVRGDGSLQQIGYTSGIGSWKKC